MANTGDNKRQQVASGQIDHVGVPLWQASTAFTRRMIETVQEAGFEDISIADSELLPFLDLEGTSLSEIAHRKGTSRQAVHQSVHSLIKRGYLELVPHPDDARARVARHTEKGLSLVDVLQGVKSDLNARALAAIGPRKMKELTKTLETLTGVLSTSPSED